MVDPVIVSACRTPVGRFQGSLSNVSASRLGAIVVKETIESAGLDKEDIEEVIMGNVISAGLGQAPARQAQIYAGLPVHIGALTINKVCGSGLKAIVLAAQAIKAGDAKCIIAGGMENMTQGPYLLMKGRSGYRLGHDKLLDATVQDGLWDVYFDMHMGNTGDIIAEKCNVSRAEADEWALRSHKHALKAIDSGKFKDEIVPVSIPQRKGNPVIFDTDEGPRRDTSLERLARLKPVFKSDGIVTAGNASSINDGASALVVMHPDYAQEKGIKPLATIKGYGTGGVEPQLVMYAPVPTNKKLFKRMDLKPKDFGLIELNEAFASQTVAVIKELGFDATKVNVNGGAVALG
ncbi:MAG: acetyl-CoA C-acyltransferase, partial [Planctomycetes bacterium]|nr:acetyl-CoA C-acyltransferase [Planctomycetota bacterium]